LPSLEPKLELRNGETIRAYLDELARLKIPVQLWLGEDDKPFETTLQGVSPITFSSTTTPPLEPGRAITLSFMLEARRFIAQVKVVASGVFRIPLTIAQGERRAEFRGLFERNELAQVFGVEQRWGTVFGGRTFQGKLLDLSPHGLRVALNEVGSLSGASGALQAGDWFAAVCITGLPFTPPIHARARVAHVVRGGPEPFAGLALEELSEGDQRNLQRILTPRFPTTFGEAFPAKKRRMDLADQLGAPTPVKIKAKAPEIVHRDVPAPEERVASSAVVRIRKAGKKILMLSEHAGSPALVEAFRADGFKNVVAVRSYPEAKAAASQTRFDMLVLDIRVGSHWAGDIVESLRSHDLMLDTPIILVVEHRNEGSVAIATAIDASWIHERRKPSEDLLPVVAKLLLE
jgi:CheY-like chemotaxis protein